MMIQPTEDEELILALRKDLARAQANYVEAAALVGDFLRGTRDHVFILTREPARRERGEKIMDRAAALLGLTRSGEPAGRKEDA